MAKKEEKASVKSRSPQRNKTNSRVGKRTEKRKRSPMSRDDLVFHTLMNVLELAIEWIQELFPERSKRYNLAKMKIAVNEFYSATLKKRVADIVYTIPLLDESSAVKLTIILEHKGQSSRAQNRVTAAQTLCYLVEHCLHEAREATKKKKDEDAGVITQPIVVVVYTGSDATLDGIRWRDYFPAAPGFEENELTFEPIFLNMTRMRLEGKLPKNPFLESMYDIMTRHDASEFVGFAQTALTPLNRKKGVWNEEEIKLAETLLNYFENHAESLNVELGEDDVDDLLNSIKLEDEMGTSLIYQRCAARAKEQGIKEGFADGLDKGVKKGVKQGVEQGRNKERSDIINEQREIFREAVQTRFGSYPSALKNALNKIQDLNSVIDLRIFALTQASSLAELVTRVKGAAH